MGGWALEGGFLQRAKGRADGRVRNKSESINRPVECNVCGSLSSQLSRHPFPYYFYNYY